MPGMFHFGFRQWTHSQSGEHTHSAVKTPSALGGCIFLQIDLISPVKSVGTIGPIIQEFGALNLTVF